MSGGRPGVCLPPGPCRLRLRLRSYIHKATLAGTLGQLRGGIHTVRTKVRLGCREKKTFTALELIDRQRLPCSSCRVLQSQQAPGNSARSRHTRPGRTPVSLPTPAPGRPVLPELGSGIDRPQTETETGCGDSVGSVLRQLAARANEDGELRGRRPAGRFANAAGLVVKI